MKLMIPCHRCIQSAFESKDVTQVIQLKQVNAELNDDGYYDVICDNGHEFIAVVQQMKFEILFDLGVMSLNDGYSREAVLNFVSSLERFFGFCVVLGAWHEGLHL